MNMIDVGGIPNKVLNIQKYKIKLRFLI